MLITLQHNTHRKLRYFHFGCDNCGDHTEICDIVILGVIIVGITFILKYQYSCSSKNENLCFHLKFIVLCVKIPKKSPGIRSKLQQGAIIKISTKESGDPRRDQTWGYRPSFDLFVDHRFLLWILSEYQP